MKSDHKNQNDLSAGSMADIAFLLLIFFLVSTTLFEDKGLTLKLPPKQEDQITAESKSRNLFKVRINSKDEILVQHVPHYNIENLREDAKAFILNYGRKDSASENPQKAILSLKTNRGSRYELYIHVLDELKGAYHEIYADKLGITLQEYLNIDNSDPELRKRQRELRSEIPMNISIAEPTL